MSQVRDVMSVGTGLQVAIVLFRTLVEFYDRPLGLTTLPLIVWRFATIGIGSILTGKNPPSIAGPFAEALSCPDLPQQNRKFITKQLSIICQC